MRRGPQPVTSGGAKKNSLEPTLEMAAAGKGGFSGADQNSFSTYWKLAGGQYSSIEKEAVPAKSGFSGRGVSQD